jgi:hypothetical protein
MTCYTGDLVARCESAAIFFFCLNHLSLVTVVMSTTFFSAEDNNQPNMSVDPAAAVANATSVAATAVVQAMSEALQPAPFSQHKLALPNFWLQESVGCFQYANVEFSRARLPANSYVCATNMSFTPYLLRSSPPSGI